MIITTTLLVNRDTVLDVVAALTDIAKPPNMSVQTTVTVRPVVGVTPPVVAIIGSTIQLDPDEILILKEGGDELAEQSFAKG